MLNLTLIDSANENGLGRFDISSLSDQMCMELLIQDSSDKEKHVFQDNAGIFLDACRWHGVRCDSDDRVVRVNLSHYIKGTVSLSYIPQRVAHFRLNMSQAEGTLDTALLPASMESFSVTRNFLSGTVDLTTLPSSILNFWIHQNSFSGSCDLTALPEVIHRLNLEENKFSGLIDLSTLPKRLLELLLGSNMFSGPLDFTHIPECLRVLALSKNNFCGEINLDSLPSGIELNLSNNSFCGQFRLQNIGKKLYAIDAQDNEFSGTAVVCGIGETGYISLHGNRIDAIIDENGTTHKSERLMLKSIKIMY